MYTILNPNSNKVQAGNGWEDQLCGMKSMAFKGSGRPGRRDSIEEDSIFRFLYFSFQRLLHLTFPALARLWWARVTRSTPTSATTTLQAATWRPNNLFLFHISDPVIIWIIVNLNSDQIILNSDQIWSFYSSSSSLRVIIMFPLVRFPNCIVYSWVYNTQKTVKFDFDCFHSLH